MQTCSVCEFSFDKNISECPKCEIENTDKKQELITKAAITARLTTPKGDISNDIVLNSEVGKLWPTNDEICFKLINQVEKKFTNKGKFHSYLDENDSFRSKPTYLKNYIDNKINFRTLVDYFMDELLIEARRVGSKKITGGNILFMHYKSHDANDLGRFLAILVDKKDGFDFEENSLKPINTPHLNLDSLRQAVMFDLTLFDEVYPDRPNNDTYLKFIMGNSTAGFFKKAFGCNQNNIDNAKSVFQLRDAISEYTDKFQLGPNFYQKAKNSFESIILETAKKKGTVSVETLYDAIEKNLPSSHSHLKGNFKNFIAQNDYEINHFIEPTKPSAESGKYVNIETEDKSFTGKVARKRVGKTGSGKPIEYEDGILTIRITSPSQKEEFEKLIAVNDDE